jgi:hypothetical protein
MPSIHPRISLTLTAEELQRLRRDARDKESDSNLIRRKLKLKPLKQGAPEGNQNAVGK